MEHWDKHTSSHCSLAIIGGQGHSPPNCSKPRNLPLAWSSSLSRCIEMLVGSHLCRRYDGLGSDLRTSMLWEEKFRLLSRYILASPLATKLRKTYYSSHNFQGLRRVFDLDSCHILLDLVLLQNMPTASLTG